MRTYLFSAASVLLILIIQSCTPHSGGEALVAGEALPTDSIPEGVTYQLDTLFSTITWIGSKPNGQHNGTIDIDSGTIIVKDSNIVGGRFQINIQSLDIKDLAKDSEQYPKLKRHLMSPDFFYTDSFPTGSFEIVSVVSYDSTINIASKAEFETDHTPAGLSEFMVKNPTHYVTGNLTLRGVTKSLSFPARIMFRNDKILSEAKFNIDRTDWRLSYSDESTVSNKAKDKFIYNTVNVGYSIEAKLVQ